MDKFCINCKHYANPISSIRLCARNIKSRRDLVTGIVRTYGTFDARRERSQGLCGEKGNYFTPK